MRGYDPVKLFALKGRSSGVPREGAGLKGFAAGAEADWLRFYLEDILDLFGFWFGDSSLFHIPLLSFIYCPLSIAIFLPG